MNNNLHTKLSGLLQQMWRARDPEHRTHIIFDRVDTEEFNAEATRILDLLKAELFTPRLADLDAGEERTRQLLADAEQKRQVLLHTLAQIQGSRQALKSLLEGKADE